MIFAVKLKPWFPMVGEDHILTKYEIYGNKELTELILSVESPDLLFYTFNLDIPIDTTYYIRTIREFDITIDYTSEVYEITNDSDKVNRLLSHKPITIEQPIVHVDRNAIDRTFTINTKQYIGSDSHTHTHWYIVSNFKVIYSELNSEHLMSITLPYDIIQNEDVVRFYAVHCCNNIESEVGYYELQITKGNFKITSKLTNLDRTSNVYIDIEKLDDTKPLGISYVNLQELDGSIIKVYYALSVELGSKPLIIRKEDIKESKMDLVFYIEKNNGQLTSVRRRIEFTDYLLDQEYDKNYVYRNTVKNTELEFIHDLEVDSSSIGVAIANNIYLPYQGKIYSYNLNRTLGTMTKMNNIDITISDTPGTYVDYVNGNMVIDSIEDGVPTFIILRHNINQDSFVVVHIIPREDEITTVAVNNGITNISEQELIYNVNGSNRIKILNIEDGTVREVSPLPLPHVRASIPMRIYNGRIMFASDETNEMVEYHVDTDKYISTLNLHEDIDGKDLRAMRLYNSNVLLYNPNGTGAMVFNTLTLEFEKQWEGFEFYGNDTLFSNYGEIVVLRNDGIESSIHMLG